MLLTDELRKTQTAHPAKASAEAPVACPHKNEILAGSAVNVGESRPPQPLIRSTMVFSALSLAVAACAGVLIAQVVPQVGGAIAVAAVLAVGTGVGVWYVLVRPKLRLLGRLCYGLREFADRSFSARLGPEGERAFGDLACRFDALGAALSAKQGDMNERDQLVKTIVGCAPMAIVLYGDTGRIVYSNEEARELFFEGRALEGHNFLQMLQRAAPSLRSALLADTDALFTLEDSEERETYHLAKRYFEIEGESHTLVMVKHLTRELGRREAEVYKRVIRVISHEFNNSLAPITSLIHSARLIAQKPEHLPKLDKVLDTIEERARHLNTFLEGYASFARLPRPKPEVVSITRFLDGVHALWPSIHVSGAPEKTGYFDPAQMQQVLINLLKNADEAKGPRTEVNLTVEPTPDGGTRFAVADRGSGMSCGAKNAIEPFFSTKERGSGVGLALCREIIEAHNGKLKIEPRTGGGTVVSCWLPGQGSVAAGRTGRLTLSHG